MNLPRTPGDLHATREAMKTGRIRHPEVLEQAAAIAQSAACRHVFMPGRAQNPSSTPTARSSTVFNDPDQVLAGLPISVKDLFDVAGQTTTAGSAVLAGAELAGRTNMVEFAFSCVGINPHYGTPLNTAVVNMLDGCAISLPCHAPGQLPVGLMLWHAALHDDTLLDLALQVETTPTQSL